MVGKCTASEALPVLLRLLKPAQMRRNEPEAVQLSACIGLGYYAHEEARHTLLQILHPRLLSRYRGKSDMVRAAAVTALGKQLPDIKAEKAIRIALTDNNPFVRQAAQQVLQQHV